MRSATTFEEFLAGNRQYRNLQAKSEKLSQARAALPAGTSRAKVTTANARWARAAEAREQLRAALLAEWEARQQAAAAKKAAVAEKKKAAQEKRQAKKEAADKKKKAAQAKAAAQTLARAEKIAARSKQLPTTMWAARFKAALQLLHPSITWTNESMDRVYQTVVPLWRVHRWGPEEAAQAVCLQCEELAQPLQAAPLASEGRYLAEPVKAKPRARGAALRLEHDPSLPDKVPGARRGRKTTIAPASCPADKPECGYTVQGGTCTISARLSVPSKTSQRTERIPARYCLVEMADLHTSNLPLSDFAPDPDFPPEAQERDYRLPAEQAKVRGIAEDYQPELIFNTNPGAIDGVPIANEDRLVLGGNGRTMATVLVYAGRGNVPADSPKQYLIEQAHEFGLSPEVVASFEQPMLVRTIQTGRDRRTLADWSRRLNTSLSQQLDATRLAVSRARFLDEGTLRQLTQTMAEDETLAAFLSSRRSRPFVQALQSNGIITTRDAAAYLHEGLLNEAGRDLVEDLLVAVLLPDAALITAYGRGPVGVLARAAPYLVIAGQAPEFDLRDPLRKAVRDRLTMRAQGIADVALFVKQQGLFAGSGAATEGDPRARALLYIMAELDAAPVRFSRFARRYAELAQANPTAQGGLFAGEKLSPLDALKKAATEAGVKLP
jgi:hypothetical protein